MNVNPTENQTLLLWRIVASKPEPGEVKQAGEVMQKDLGIKVIAADRKRLEGLGLLRVEPVKRTLKLTVTDKGWAWANQNLGAALPEKASGKITPLLQRWLALLKGYLDRHGGSLSDVFQPGGTETPRELASQIKSKGVQKNLHERVRSEYLALTHGQIQTRCLLRDLRARLNGVPRADLDIAIGKMVTSGEAVLFRLDNRLEITPDDIQAALHVGGEQQHILWMDR